MVFYMNEYQSDRLSDGQTLESHFINHDGHPDDMATIVIDKRIVLYYESVTDDKFDKIFFLLKKYISKVVVLEEDFVHPPIQEIERKENV